MDENKSIDSLINKEKTLSSDLVNCLNELAVACNSSGQTDEAIAYLEKALKINPENPATFHHLGIVYGNRKEYDKAIEYYKKSLEINPANASSLNNLGFIYECNNRADLAIEHYEKALSANSSYVNAIINLVNAYNRINQKDKAVENFKRVFNMKLTLNNLYEIEKRIYDEDLRYLLLKDKTQNQNLEYREYPDIKIGIIYFAGEKLDQAAYQDFLNRLDDQPFKNYSVIPVEDSLTDLEKIKEFTHICLIEQYDLISGDALVVLSDTIDKNPDLELLYSDEDILNGDNDFKKPYFKTEYAEFILYSHNYMNALLCLKLNEDVVNSLNSISKINQNSLYELVLKLTRNPIKVHRIPRILYHRFSQNHADIEKSSTADIVENELKARNYNAKLLEIKDNFNIVKFYNTDEPKISIIIPFKDKVDLLKNCIESIESKSTYPNYEIIIVNNRSTKEESLKYFQETKHKKLNADFDFNYSRINNLAVEMSEGEYLLSLNNDTEIISPDWMESLLGLAQLDKVGLVGAKLLYQNNSIQHSGMVKYGNGRILHSNRFVHSGSGGYRNYNHIIREYLAVTGACVMISKDKFHKIGGFDEKLTVHFNDVDLSYKCINAGFINLYNPHCILYHLESISTKGLFTETITENYNYYYDKWKNIITRDDPYYNPNLSDYRVDFSIKIL